MFWHLVLMRFVMVFTARRVCIAQTMPSQDVRLSVCPSVCHMPVSSLNGYTYLQSFFSPSGSPTILVFTYKPHPSFQMVPVWMTFSDLLKVMIIQCQITWKWYNIQLYSQWPTSRKSYTVYRAAPFSMTLNDPYTQFQGHAIFWRWTSQKRYDIQT